MTKSGRPNYRARAAVRAIHSKARAAERGRNAIREPIEANQRVIMEALIFLLETTTPTGYRRQMRGQCNRLQKRIDEDN